MPCDTRPDLTAVEIKAQQTATERLEAALALGSVTLKIGPQGAITFSGWTAEDRAGLSDICVYRRLSVANSPALRKALARAEALAGRKVDAHAIAHGWHSHDNGSTWSHH